MKKGKTKTTSASNRLLATVSSMDILIFTYSVDCLGSLKN